MKAKCLRYTSRLGLLDVGLRLYKGWVRISFLLSLLKFPFTTLLLPFILYFILSELWRPFFLGCSAVFWEVFHAPSLFYFVHLQAGRVPLSP